MNTRKRFLALAAGFLVLVLAGHAQTQSAEMRITVLWADGHRLNDKPENDVQGMPGASNSNTGGAGERVSGNAIANMDIRVMLLNEDGSTVADSSPDSEGMVKFTVTGSVRNPSTGATIYPAYRLRVRGSYIEEQYVDNLQPGLADRMVTVEIHRKGEKASAGGGLVSVAKLKIPRKAEKQFERGQKALAKDRLPEARIAFERAVAIYPKYDAAFNSLGVVRMKLGDSAGGRKAFEQALAANDKYAPAYVNMARLAALDKHYEEAANFLSRSLALEPLNPEALSMLCQFDVIQNKYDEVPALAQKMHSVPHDGQALGHYAAATALEHLNRPSEAVYEYMLFMKEDPTSKLADDARTRVDNLQQQLKQANAQ